MEAKSSMEAESSMEEEPSREEFGRGTKRPADYLAEEAEDILDFIQSQFSTLLFYYNAGDIVVVILSFHGNSTFHAF